jgi:hypothetical protein
MIKNIFLITEEDKNASLVFMNSHRFFEAKKIMTSINNLEDSIKEFDDDELEELQDKCRIELDIRKLNEEELKE